MPWLIAYAIATCVSLVCMYMKLRAFYEQIRNRNAEGDANSFVDDDEDHYNVTMREKLIIHRNRLVATSRKIKLMLVGTLIGVSECL